MKFEKTKQLSLMFNSLCVIQPSLFEGGPGGFSLMKQFQWINFYYYQILKLIKKKSNRIVFFKKNAKDLFDKMNKIYKKTQKKLT